MSTQNQDGLAAVTDRGKHRRDNHWGDTNTDTDADADMAGDGTDDVEGAGGHQTNTTSDTYAEFVAKQELKKGATFISPLAARAPDEYDLHTEPQTVEMTDPDLFVRENDTQLVTSYGLYPRRHDKFGYISTGRIANRDHESFMATVDRILDAWVRRGKLRHSERNRLRRAADRQKRNGHQNDVEIVADLVKARESRKGVDDYFSHG